MALIPPFAQLTVAINGGAAATGAINVAANQTVQLGATNTSGWSSWVYEIYGYPPGWTPGGAWALGPDGYTYQNTKATPDSFSTSTGWGKWMLRLRINGNPLVRAADGSPNTAYQSQLTDESTALYWASPHGLRDLGDNESAQFNSKEGWVGDQKANLRTLEGFIATGVGLPGWFTVTHTSNNGAVLTNAQTEVLIDTSGGSAGCTTPTTPADSQRLRTKDAAGTWQTTTPTLTASAGQKIEEPQAPGTYSTAGGTVNLPAGKGYSQDFEWSATYSTWFLA